MATEGFPSSGQTMGLGGLLRAWREAAGARQGRQITQLDMAMTVGRSERWYRGLERGATTRSLDRTQCEALAELLQLTRDESHALLLYNNLGITGCPEAASDPRVRSALRLIIDKQMPDPTYLCDSRWNILAYNRAMAEWWPWVIEPGANLMRWALTDPEARTQYHDWHQHAAAYVRLLKYAMATPGPDPDLLGLINDVCKDPDVRRIWDTVHEHGQNRDGHVFRMSVPVLDWEAVEVVSHVLYPAGLPDCRLVVITWWTEEDDGERDPLGGVRNAWAQQPSLADAGGRVAAAEGMKGPARSQRRTAQTLAGRLSVPSAGDAAALAAEDRIELPILSKMIGADVQLTLSPSTRTVIWAVRDDEGEWTISEVDAYNVVVRMPHAVTEPAAREEMLHLTRAVLPDNPEAAIAKIDELAAQARARIDILLDIRVDLANAVLDGIKG
ncbi:helix-turn-helix transcriptional regulator [Streptomyces sp. WAC05950]|uniref:helix-turn-helix transcriptional regulator n=1 Tax=Streptomyces sp. WAC05950 TaxID=2487419 RepID=UPI00163BA6F0|nr:helix-turn-helix transcriptional regulator [Streptomyces sp. WAC05950]